jgi:hypothetical protein
MKGKERTYKGLFIKRAVLLLELDIGKPWLDTTGITQ